MYTEQCNVATFANTLETGKQSFCFFFFLALLSLKCTHKREGPTNVNLIEYVNLIDHIFSVVCRLFCEMFFFCPCLFCWLSFEYRVDVNTTIEIWYAHVQHLIMDHIFMTNCVVNFKRRIVCYCALELLKKNSFNFVL